MSDSHDITRMLRQWTAGAAVDNELIPLLYEQLKQLAHARLSRERRDHTLGTTGLVHEAYLRLAKAENLQIQDRAHFLSLASSMMRRILVDYARARSAEKRGGGAGKLPLREELIPADRIETILELDDALARLEEVYPRPGQAVELHYFGGLTLEEAGEVLGVSAATVMRDLRFAEAWLRRRWTGDLSALLRSD